MAFQFRKAARTERKIRVALDGPSGSGKTYSLLRLAFALRAGGLCARVAVIDSENGGSEAYAGEAPDGEPWAFDVLNLTTYSPTTYVEALRAATDAGYDCVVVDSLSHAWMGKDGTLDLVDRKGGRFDAWKDVTPLQRQMIDAVIHCPAHVLASMRTKSEYVVEDEVNKQGKAVKVPRKIGLAPVQRDGVEYEFDLYGSIDQEHVVRITKSRCSALQDATAPRPGPAFWAPLVRWLSTAEPVRPLADTLGEAIDAAGTEALLRAAWAAAYGSRDKLAAAAYADLEARKNRRKAALANADLDPPRREPGDDLEEGP